MERSAPDHGRTDRFYPAGRSASDHHHFVYGRNGYQSHRGAFQAARSAADDVGGAVNEVRNQPEPNLQVEAGVAEECVTRMRVELNRRGFEVGDKKVRRMMGVMGIICIYL